MLHAHVVKRTININQVIHDLAATYHKQAHGSNIMRARAHVPKALEFKLLIRMVTLWNRIVHVYSENEIRHKYKF